MPSISPPAPSEYAPYYQKYVGLVDGDPFDVLRRQPDELHRLAAALGEARADVPYAPGKWTLKQIVSHVIDTERVFAYRALRIGRGDTTPLPGFEQDLFAAHDDVSGWTLAGLAGAFERLRRSNLDLFEHFDEAALQRTGTASDNLVSVRALLYICAGHVQHHLRQLEALRG